MSKKCCMCKQEKALDCFSKNGRAKDGLQTLCKECALEYSRRPENKKKRSLQAAERWRNGCIRDERYQRLYGMTIRDYYRMLFEQNEVCKVCGRPNDGGKMLAVDHDHKTGKVRGLLCNNCNSLVGFAKDKTEWLDKAAAYLAAHENQITPGEP